MLIPSSAGRIHEAVHPITTQISHIMKRGATVDARIISVPNSIKSIYKQRDPKMNRAKRENKYKVLHRGEDDGSGYVRSMEVTTADV